MRDFAFRHSKLCVLVWVLYVCVVMYMVWSVAFYWREALIVAVKPYLNRFVRTGPLESLYTELFTHMASFTMASPRVGVCVCVCVWCMCVCVVCVCVWCVCVGVCVCVGCVCV